MSEKIRVLIVDDHEMVRMGLRAYLETEKDIDVCGEASNGREGINESLRLLPDVILMDLVMEVMDGITATKAIIKEFKKIKKEVKIIILTSFIEEEKTICAIEAGTFSFLLKTSSADEIATAIRKAMKNEAVIDSKATNFILNKVSKPQTKHSLLTNREVEVLKLLGAGKSNKEISADLFIGIKTVKTHVSNVLAKLELGDRTKASVYANKNKIE
ncbi:MAG: response regulator [Alkaliphilus sp.]